MNSIHIIYLIKNYLLLRYSISIFSYYFLCFTRNRIDWFYLCIHLRMKNYLLISYSISIFSYFFNFISQGIELIDFIYVFISFFFFFLGGGGCLKIYAKKLIGLENICNRYLLALISVPKAWIPNSLRWCYSHTSFLTAWIKRGNNTLHVCQKDLRANSSIENLQTIMPVLHPDD